MELEAFIRRKDWLPPAQEAVISKRFLENGAYVKWEITPISVLQWRKISMEEDKWACLAAASVSKPDLKDKGLQKSYQAKNEVELLKRMLRPGEYLRLIRKVKEVNGFQERRKRLYEDAKN